MEAVRPDYNGAWNGAVVPALLEGTPLPGLPADGNDRDGVVLLVLDGLGWHALHEHADQLPTLASLGGTAVTTVFPSTTASALTSITTGLPPAEHGLIGYRMRVGGDVLATLQWRLVGRGQPPDPDMVQPHLPFLGRDVPVVTRARFGQGGFSRAHLRGTTLLGWQTPAVLVEWCRRLAASSAPFVYAYYDGIDKVAHAHGLTDGFYAAELAAADRLVADLLDVLPRRYQLVVTSDHGQVHVDEEDHLVLDGLRSMVTAVTGDARFRSLYARPGANAELQAAVAERVGERAWMFLRDQVLEEGWLGPRPGVSVAGRVGDVVLAARGGHAFLDPDFPKEAGMRSMHGSLTPQEMLVPLLAARGTGR